MSRKQLIAGLALIAVIGACASAAWARTWHVAQDGTGDFSVIQDAVDAAADGDSIQIGPGLYSDYSFGYNNTIHDVYGCINITKDMLTFIGAGLHESVIGFTEYPEDLGFYINGINSIAGHHVVLVNIAVQCLMNGAYWEGGFIDSIMVDYRQCDICVFALGSGRVVDCLVDQFASMGILLGSDANGFEVAYTEFRNSNDGRAVTVTVAQNVLLQGLDINTSIGISVQQGASATVRDCTIVATGNLAFGTAYAGSVVLSDCWLQGTQALVFDGVGSLVGENCILMGGTWSTITTYNSTLNLHNCQIINGGGYSVRASMSASGLTEPLVLDLSGNYWGTADPAQIEAWILDYNDYDPNEGNHFVVVDYQPFMADTVSVEKRSWSEVKELFRD